ncbi:hypothetical protein ACFVJK_46830 [Streptomyces sp. NPDC127172]|uniref:hypothetical protein n=1 Tax=Streptomyces sp. NPDC127172 TaxID=3345382 RepID=UPI00363E5B67
MRCGNDPRAQWSPGDRAVVAGFIAYLAAKAGDAHQWAGDGEDRKRCAVCGVTAVRQHSREYGAWTEYRVPSGWTWSAPDGSDTPPPCPPPPVEALCPWEMDAMRYAGAKGDDQLETAMRTWCETHERAVSECEDPGPLCPGAPAHEDGEPAGPGPCTGREDTCRCMCPACCGDDWSAPGDY